MADFGFIGPSYNAPSIYVDAQECINFFPEIDPLKQPGSRGVVALYPTPGLSIQATLQTASPHYSVSLAWLLQPSVSSPALVHSPAFSAF